MSSVYALPDRFRELSMSDGSISEDVRHVHHGRFEALRVYGSTVAQDRVSDTTTSRRQAERIRIRTRET